MPTLKNCASDMASALAGQTVGSVTLAASDNLFYRRVHPMPQGLVVQLLNVAGPSPMPFLGTGTSLYKGAVQCTIYGSPGEDGFAQGEALARGVAGYLHQLIPTGYISVFVRDGSPINQEPDPESQRHRWLVNIEAQYVA